MARTRASRGAPVRGRGPRGRGRGRGRVAAADSHRIESDESLRTRSDHGETEISQTVPAVAAPGGVQGVQALAEALLLAIHSIGGGDGIGAGGSLRIIRLVDGMRKAGVVQFSGCTEPIEAQDWITHISMVMDSTGMPSEDRLSCVQLLLTGDAESWWSSEVMVQTIPGVVTWDFFVTRFRAHFIPKVYSDQMVEQFLTLRQDGRALGVYIADFTHLLRYAAGMMTEEDARCRRFEAGLDQAYRERVILQRATTLDSVIEFARLAESALQPVSHVGGPIRHSRGVSDGATASGVTSTVSGSRSSGGYHPYQRPAQSGGGQRQSQSFRGGHTQIRPQQTQSSYASTGGVQRTTGGGGQYQQPRYCAACTRTHTGSCRQCYYCQGYGHYARECRRRRADRSITDVDTSARPSTTSRAGDTVQGDGAVSYRGTGGDRARGGGRARAYSITGHQTLTDTDDISGTIIISGTPACVFISGTNNELEKKYTYMNKFKEFEIPRIKILMEK